ncbi:MAG TPA: tripartite tricarboxylate transporter substrate binding protein [Burkholderiales bacterium]|nr:tripartite tricarboxylate transporter substrate binding protein [Burkholderiales bacterium]
MHRRSCALAASLALGFAAAPVWSQSYPAKPVRLVVGFAPGGSTDVVARIVSKKLGESFGQSVIVDNRPGASSNIAAQHVARSPADGYTLLYMTSTLVVNVSLYPKLPFGVLEDFVAITPTVDIPCTLSVHPSLPVKSVKELVTFARARPGQISYGSAGNGSGTHLQTELFKTMAGIDLLHVPYKGSGPATNEFLGGHVQVLFVCNVSYVKENSKAGRLRPLAVTSRERLSNLPELPTMSEAGIKGYEATIWNGMLAPAGTPREIVARVNRETAQAVRSVTSTLVEMAAYPMYATPEEFAAFVKNEIGKWAGVVKRAGAKAQ